MLRAITVDDFTRVQVLYQHGHIRLPRYRVACQEINAQYNRRKKVH